jgi:hypothetical protein
MQTYKAMQNQYKLIQNSTIFRNFMVYHRASLDEALGKEYLPLFQSVNHLLTRIFSYTVEESWLETLLLKPQYCYIRFLCISRLLLPEMFLLKYEP